VKFRGAGQGGLALVAEWLAGEIGRALGLLVPDMVEVDLAAPIAEAEPHEEIHDLLVASVGSNVGLDFLPGALTFNPVVDRIASPEWAADVVWFDALVTNPDRSVKNPNLLAWHGRTWLIDHGATLYIHHTWRDPGEHARRPFERSAEHVLLPYAGSIAGSDERLAPLVSRSLLEALVAEIPADWLPADSAVGGRDDQRRAYVDYLLARLDARRAFVEEADRARAAA
jgi:hypothetical protein